MRGYLIVSGTGKRRNRRLGNNNPAYNIYRQYCDVFGWPAIILEQVMSLYISCIRRRCLRIYAWVELSVCWLLTFVRICRTPSFLESQSLPRRVATTVTHIEKCTTKICRIALWGPEQMVFLLLLFDTSLGNWQ